MREETNTQRLFAVIRDVYKSEEDKENKKNGWPKFCMNNKEYSMVSGLIQSVETEKKKIIPTTGTNAGIEITIKNLVISIVDQEGEFDLQIPLYSALARNIMNALAGPDKLNEVFFSTYNNKNGFRSITLRKSKEKDDYLTPYYTRDQEINMVEEKEVQGEMKKDFDALTDKYIKELLPIIAKKIGVIDNLNDTIHEKGAVVPLGDSPTVDQIIENNKVDDDYLPF